MNKVRWGLLSTANINRRLIPAIRQSERGELVAVASRSSDKVAAYAKEWDIPQTFDSYEAMLSSDAIDAVYISLPNHLHREWAEYAMRQGKHVLCEKPFAITLADVDSMTAVSKETGVVLAEAFMYRHHPQTKLIGEMIDNGRLGKIRRLEASFSFQITVREGYQKNIRLQPNLGGGSLWDIGIYPISLAQYVMGSAPDTVYGFQQVGESGVDEQFFGQMVYANGGVAQINSSFHLPFYTRAQIFGDNGRLEIMKPFTGIEPPEQKLIFYTNDGQAEEIHCAEEYLYLGEVKDMHSAIIDGKPNYLSLSETRNHVATALALYESAKIGRVIQMK